jgi:hypothetical protein
MCSTHGDARRGHRVSAPTDDALGNLDTAVTALTGARLDTMNTGQRLAAIAAINQIVRRLAGVENELLAGLQREATPAELGDGLTSTLARVMRVTKAEAGRRVRDADDVAARTGLTGEPLTPRFPATAAGVNTGLLDRTHVREIHRFFDLLPNGIPVDERDRTEEFLADLASRLRPDELRKAADQLLAYLGREDDFSDVDRARRRGFTWSPPDVDGMSKATLWATPALRAELDAVFAAWSAPGKCNPNDETPCVDGDPAPQVAERDGRTPAQRRHDALSAISRAMLASGQLGSHNGLPVTLIVTATLQELQAGVGKAHTGGGTLLPMTDVIRMATHANHYLVVVDGIREIPLWLGRTRRTASPGQRIVLHATDRGCSFPGCDMPGYLCQVHHAVCDWANGGLTNIDDLTFACPAHHRLVECGGWTTRKNAYGHTEWVPPPQLELPAATNGYHHPERLLLQSDTGRGGNASGGGSERGSP